jgi:glutaminyl-peptide cyclotransferase
MAVIAAAISFVALFNRPEPPPVHRWELLDAYPHDAGAFTQGLLYEDGFLYESTGRNGESSLRKVAVETGEVVQRVNLEDRYFAEGIAVVGEEMYQITWRSRTGFVYDKTSFKKLREFQYTGEGWGLAYDGRHLVMSDGSDVLRFFDPPAMREVRRLRITSGGRRLDRLNELEFAGGFLYANIWYSDSIAKISPQSGEVVAVYDMSGLYPRRQRQSREMVLNGIAYDEAADRFFLTGKNWPRLFAVRLTGEPAPRRHE